MSSYKLDADGSIVILDSDSDDRESTQEQTRKQQVESEVADVRSRLDWLEPLSAGELTVVRRRVAGRRTRPLDDIVNEVAESIVEARETAEATAGTDGAATGSDTDGPAASAGRRQKGGGGGPSSSSAAAAPAAAGDDGPPPAKRRRAAPGSGDGGGASSSSSSAAAGPPRPRLWVDTDADSVAGSLLADGAGSSSAAAAAPAAAAAAGRKRPRPPAAAPAATAAAALPAASSPPSGRAVRAHAVYSARAAAYVDPRDRVLIHNAAVRTFSQQLRALRSLPPSAAAAGSPSASTLLDVSAGMLSVRDLYYPQPQLQQQPHRQPRLRSPISASASSSSSSAAASSSSSSSASKRRGRTSAPFRLAASATAGAGAGAGSGDGAPGELFLFTRKRALAVPAARRQLREQLAWLTGPALLAASAALRPPSSNPLVTCGRRDYLLATTRAEHEAMLVDPAARDDGGGGGGAPPLQLPAGVAAAWAVDMRGAPEVCAWRVDLFTWAGRRRRHHPPPAVCAGQYCYRPPPPPPPPRQQPRPPAQQGKGGAGRRGAGAGSSYAAASSPAAAASSPLGAAGSWSDSGSLAEGYASVNQLSVGSSRAAPPVYYHSRSGQVIQPWEADVDSEDEDADELATATLAANLRGLLSTHAGARADVTTFLRAWGEFVTAERPVRTITDLPPALLQFVQARWRALVALPPAVWRAFVGGLWTHVFADAPTLLRCAHMLEEAWWRRERERLGTPAAGSSLWTGGAPRAPPTDAAASSSAASSSSSSAAAPAPPQLPPPGDGARWQDWLPPDLVALAGG